MKVVFGIDRGGQTSELAEMLFASVDSLRRNTSHEAVVVSERFEPSVVERLVTLGARTCVVDTPLKSAIEAANKASGYPLQAVGNYLRYEGIRVVEDPFVLYCDCDTLFLRDFTIDHEPKVLAAVSQYALEDTKVNSGVLYVNRHAFLEELDAFYAFAAANLERLFPGFDEPALNEFFQGRLEALDPKFNWRPYWAKNSDAAILHNHGVKVGAVAAFFEGTAGSFLRKPQVLEIAVRTLENIDFYMERLGRDFVEAHAYTRALAELGARARIVLADPITYLFGALGDAVAGERKRQLGLACASLEALVEAGKGVSLTLPKRRLTDVRFVLDGPGLAFTVTDLRDVTGSSVVPIASSTRAGVDVLQQEDGRLTFARTSLERFADVVLRVPDGHAEGLRIEFFLYAVGTIRVYYSETGRFSEVDSQKFEVGPFEQALTGEW